DDLVERRVETSDRMRLRRDGEVRANRGPCVFAEVGRNQIEREPRVEFAPSIRVECTPRALDLRDLSFRETREVIDEDLPAIGSRPVLQREVVGTDETVEQVVVVRHVKAEETEGHLRSHERRGQVDLES